MPLKSDLSQLLDQRQQRLDELKSLLDRVPTVLEPSLVYASVSYDYIYLEFPLRPNLIWTVRRTLALAGWRLSSHYQSKETGDIRYRHYWHADPNKKDRLLIAFTPSSEFSSCQRVQTGEKVVPLYETICK